MGIFDIFNINEIKSDASKTKKELNISQQELEKTQDDLKKSQDELKKTQKELEDVYFKFSELLVDYNQVKSDFSNNQQRLMDVSRQFAKLNPEFIKLHREYDTVLTDYTKLKSDLEHRQKTLECFLSSNLTAFPFLAGMIADYLTFDLEILAKKLDWGSNIQREKKVKSIREIRADAKAKIEESKIATYQLEYLRTLFPAIDDILETDYKDLTFTKTTISEYDPIRNYISKEEWHSLSESEKNQLALDRYIESRKKTKWQIGRDYELYVGYKYSLKGYKVDFYGSYMGLEDLGRDLIAKKDGKTLIIQCKYWSQKKYIHEKHIAQLYGTAICYSLQNNTAFETVTPVLITNISLSDMAKKFAEYLSVTAVENYESGEFPRIKCNIGRDEYGFTTKIYHLPMDQQYDSVKIDKKGEFFAFTVKEAEEKGFRRAFKWHPNI